MISTKSILTEICNSGKIKAYDLSDDELRQLQTHLFKMYRDIEAVCNRHNLKICLAYGNVIGALRHGGWIPWDDDLDIHMSRHDYEELLTKYINELPSNYRVSSYHSDEGSYARFAKIYDINTVHVDLGGKKGRYSHVFIDIFPIDNCPTGSIGKLFKKSWAYFMMYTAISVEQYKGNSIKYKELMFLTKEGRRNWRFRQTWGWVFSFARPTTWNKWIERFANSKESTGYVHVMSALTSSFKPQPKDMYFPFREIELEGIGKVNVPNKAEDYLAFTYGDWKKMPDTDQQWHHWVSEFNIPE